MIRDNADNADNADKSDNVMEMNKKTEKLMILYNKYRICLGDEGLPDDMLVFGTGNPDAKLLLIGEAPGSFEMKLSRPFSGPAGKQLDELLKEINLERENIYITNTVKYRLCKEGKKKGQLRNRPATAKDISFNRHFLVEEIEILKPSYVATLGNVALRAVLQNDKAVIGNYHGSFLEWRSGDHDFLLFPLHHPASIIYNKNLRDVFLSDLKKLSQMIHNL
ncbi:MAG: uracil-DNA glycosylase [Clostridiales bacterium]|nr:uracil-DNA glycosylase [Clostridiales bacterium]